MPPLFHVTPRGGNEPRQGSLRHGRHVSTVFSGRKVSGSYKYTHREDFCFRSTRNAMRRGHPYTHDLDRAASSGWCMQRRSSVVPHTGPCSSSYGHTCVFRCRIQWMACYANVGYWMKSHDLLPDTDSKGPTCRWCSRREQRRKRSHIRAVVPTARGKSNRGAWTAPTCGL